MNSRSDTVSFFLYNYFLVFDTQVVESNDRVLFSVLLMIHIPNWDALG